MIQKILILVDDTHQKCIFWLFGFQDLHKLIFNKIISPHFNIYYFKVIKASYYCGYNSSNYIHILIKYNKYLI